jgi:chaperone modulatory protein CbpM
MASHSRPELVEETTTFTLRELCERGDIHAEYVIKLVSYGVIEPVEEAAAREWRFDVESLARLRKAQRLQRDLKLNVPGLAVSLELLDDVSQLRREVERLRQQVRQLRGE